MKLKKELKLIITQLKMLKDRYYTNLDYSQHDRLSRCISTLMMIANEVGR